MQSMEWLLIGCDQLSDVHGLVTLYAVHEDPSLAQQINVGKIDTRNIENLKRLSSLLHQESTRHLRMALPLNARVACLTVFCVGQSLCVPGSFQDRS